MRAAIYIRVSTEEQAKEGYSISAQLKRLKSFCISQNWDVVDVYADEGISAKDMNRPELQRMINDIKQSKIDVVLVYRLDRLTRSVSDLYDLLELFEKHDCKFKSATEVYDTTTAMGRMFITIVAALAQWERENMGERIAMGFEEKVRQGKWPLNFAPFGYGLNKEESKLYINPVEAKTVRLIYDLYLEGYGTTKISKYLNKKKILTRRNKEWSSDTIIKVLKSASHIGGIVWNGKRYLNLHESIVTMEEWEKVQYLLKNRRKMHPSSVSSPYLFSGLIRCNSCGQHLSGQSTSDINSKGEKVRYYYYTCGAIREGKCDSKIRSWSEAKLEKELLKKLNKITFDPTIIKKVGAMGLPADKQINIDVVKLEKELNDLEEMKKKWQYAWVENMISDEDFKNRMQETNDKIESIRELLSEHIEAQEVDEEINEEELIAALLDIKENWNKMSKLEKKNLLNEIIKEIKVTKVGRSDIRIDGIIFM